MLHFTGRLANLRLEVESSDCCLGIAAAQRISSAFFLLKQRKFLTDAGLFEFWDVAPGIYIHRNSWFALSLQFGLEY